MWWRSFEGEEQIMRCIFKPGDEIGCAAGCLIRETSSDAGGNFRIQATIEVKGLT